MNIFFNFQKTDASFNIYFWSFQESFQFESKFKNVGEIIKTFVFFEIGKGKKA